MQEHQVKPSNVYAVTPGSRPGALRGLSGDLEVLTFPGWAKASPSLIEATEIDIRIIRATRSCPPPPPPPASTTDTYHQEQQ